MVLLKRNRFLPLIYIILSCNLPVVFYLSYIVVITEIDLTVGLGTILDTHNENLIQDAASWNYKINRASVIVHEDRRITLCKLIDVLRFSYGSAFSIMHDHTNVTGWGFYYDNARSHVANKVMQHLARFNITCAPHPPYIPDLAPYDVLLFLSLITKLRVIRFDNSEAVLNKR
ncbi:hypothetical protein C0J52_23671 [Blattella germanica]|nr:hypothetical protein C0J52_23671 [Blattella germanica]